MSTACSCPVPLPNSIRTVPGEPDLVGHETLDDFVRMISVREKAQAKRSRFPDLAPCDTTKTNRHSLLKRVTRTLFCA